MRWLISKSTYYCSRKPEFGSQHPHWLLTPAITPAPRDQMPSSGFHRPTLMCTCLYKTAFCTFVSYWLYLGISHHAPHQPSCVHPSNHDLLSRKEGERKKKRSILRCWYTHWSLVKLLVASPTRESESFSTCTPARSHQLLSAEQQLAGKDASSPVPRSGYTSTPGAVVQWLVRGRAHTKF